ncbi:MAG: hypothetical protein KDA75_21275, partial [Planctomycetaceae bacterium]|nr:hypothetical protein [Planctomycetaceae bacterium]
GLTERDSLLAKLHNLRVERLLKFESLTMLQDENQRRIAAFSEQTQSGATPPAVSVLKRDEASSR